jgi:diguanylate cyclase (GGDEF)-like protein
MGARVRRADDTPKERAEQFMYDRPNRWFVIACWLAVLEVAAYFTATRFVSGDGTSGAILGDLVYPQSEALATVMLAWAGRRASGSIRRFFWWIAVSTAMGLCGDVVWAVLVLVRHAPPSPSLADVFYLASISALFPALWVQFGSPFRRWRQALDASLVVLLVVYIAFSHLLEPQIRAGMSQAALVAVAESVLILAAGIWCIFVWMTVEDGWGFGVRLVVAGVAVEAGSWLVYAYSVSVRGIEDGTWIYTGWQASWAFMILGATATVFGVERRRRSKTRVPSTWVATGAMIALSAVAVVDSAVVSTAPVPIFAALSGLALLATRLHLTVRAEGRLAAQMHTLAETDPLTGAPNRRAFEEHLEHAARRCLDTGARVGLLVIDIDHFKTVNDGYGHPFGDGVLVEVTRRLAGCIRPSDMLARLGGEEFGVLGRGISPQNLPELAERCRGAVAASPIEVDGLPVPITISVGGACMPEHAAHSAELIRVADRALYEAKAAGRNRVHIGLRTTPQVDVPIPETGVIRCLEKLADRYADASGSHVSGPAIVSIAHRLCCRLGVSVAERRRCLAAARLRDIGMVAVPPAILAKPGPLTQHERRIVQEHVRVGAELLTALPETRELGPIVGQHHERYDGRGYPTGAAGEAISIEARIIAVAEAWIGAGAPSDADAIRRVTACAGHQFDPAVVTALVWLVERGDLHISEVVYGRAA